MKLATIIGLAFSMFCIAGHAVTDQSTYVEFSGPWSFIPIKGNSNYCGGSTNDCIVAISPSDYHGRAMFYGAKKTKTPLDTGIYILMLQKPQADSISGGDGRQAVFVDGGTTTSSIYEKLIQPTKPAQNRYAVILPYVRFDSFEEPKGKAYSEVASISNAFIDPNAVFQENPVTYTKGVRIHYKVSDLSVSLLENPDGGGGQPVAETAPIKFSMEPLDTDFRCDVPARRTFMAINDLLLKNQQRRFVDFPPYSKACRLVDPQRFEDTLPSIFTFFHVDSDNINTSVALELIRACFKNRFGLRLGTYE